MDKAIKPTLTARAVQKILRYPSVEGVLQLAQRGEITPYVNVGNAWVPKTEQHPSNIMTMYDLAEIRQYIKKHPEYPLFREPHQPKPYTALEREQVLEVAEALMISDRKGRYRVGRIQVAEKLIKDYDWPKNDSANWDKIKAILDEEGIAGLRNRKQLDETSYSNLNRKQVVPTLTAEEVAKLLGVSREMVLYLVEKGYITAYVATDSGWRPKKERSRQEKGKTMFVEADVRAFDQKYPVRPRRQPEPFTEEERQEVLSVANHLMVDGKVSRTRTAEELMNKYGWKKTHRSRSKIKTILDEAGIPAGHALPTNARYITKQPPREHLYTEEERHQVLAVAEELRYPNGKGGWGVTRKDVMCILVERYGWPKTWNEGNKGMHLMTRILDEEGYTSSSGIKAPKEAMEQTIKKRTQAS